LPLRGFSNLAAATFFIKNYILLDGKADSIGRRRQITGENHKKTIKRHKKVDNDKHYHYTLG